MDKFKLFWATLSPLSQLGIVVAVLALLLLVYSTGAGINSWLKERAFERERDTLKAEIQETRAAADASQKRAEDAEADKVKFQVALEVAGAAGNKALQKVEDAEKSFNEKAERIGADMDDCARYNLIRADLKLPPVACP